MKGGGKDARFSGTRACRSGVGVRNVFVEKNTKSQLKGSYKGKGSCGKGHGKPSGSVDGLW